MKRLLLLMAVLMTAANLFAQITPIIGTNHVCAQSTTTLSDVTVGGTWSSSNTAVATIDPSTGIVTGVTAGAVNITYTVIAGFVTKTFTVNPIPSIITGKDSTCLGGSPITLHDSVAGGTWTSSAVYIAKIGSATGTVTAISTGVVTITYKLPAGCSTTFTESVVSTTIYGVAPVCLGGTPITLTDALSGGTWSSSNTAVATVDPVTGVVAGVGAGIADITYSDGPGCTAVALISVRAVPTITPSPINACVNSTYALTGLPNGGGWSSSSPLVATVNFVGVVTAIAAGTSTITYAAPGGCTSTASITVHPLPAAITGTNFVYSTFTTGLADATPGGTWSSSNPAIGTVDPFTGVVTGISSGLFLVSYTIPTSGCAVAYRVEVNPLPAKNNLQAWYPFCGDTTDHSGPNGVDGGPDLINHSASTSPAVLTTDRFANPNSAYQFNGVNSMMNYSTFFPNSGVPPDFTYSCWVYLTTPQSSIVWYNGNEATDGFGVVINNGTMGVPGVNAGVYFGGSAMLYATQPLVPGIWHNLVLVKSGGFYHFYIDNGLGLFFLETNTPLFSDVFALGINYRSTLPGFGPIKEAFDGKIDDVVIINRQLTGPERLSLYNYNPDAKKFSLGNDTVICSDYINLAPNPQTTGGAYAWSTWDPAFGFILKDTTDTVYTVYPAPGVLGNTYQLIISKPYGCSAIDTINVYKSPIPVHLGGPLKNYCLGDTLVLTDFFPNSTFLWSTGDTSHSIDVTGSGTYTLEVDSIFHFINSMGQPDSSVCIGRDTITVHASVVPFIGLPANVANCTGAPDTLFPHTDPGYRYLWSDGTTADSLIVNTTGTYWVRITDTGCARTDTSRLLIVFDTVSFYGHDTAVCQGAQVPNAPPFATYNPIVSYQWTPTAGIAISNVYNPVIIPDTSAEYYMTVRYPGCPDIVDSFHVDVQPNPIVSIGGNRSVCNGDTLHITSIVSPSWYTHYIYKWTPAAFLDNASNSNVVFTAGDSEELVLTVTTPEFVAGGLNCIAGIDSAAIFVHPGYFDTTLADVTLCPGDSVQLIPMLNVHGTLTNTTFSAFHWSPGTYLDDSTSAMPWVHPITSQHYRLINFSQYGCADTIGVNIGVYPNAVINLGDSVIMSPGDSYQISPQTNCVFFQWFPLLGLSNPNVADPVASPEVSTSYVVIATTENNCTVVDSIRIHIDPGTLITIPNAFTPGASVNNIFYVIKKGLVGLDYFRIFDKWGNKVYESKNIDAGWDGNFNGKPQPFGVYVYDIEAISNTGRIFHRVGNVTLIR